MDKDKNKSDIPPPPSSPSGAKGIDIPPPPLKINDIPPPPPQKSNDIPLPSLSTLSKMSVAPPPLTPKGIHVLSPPVAQPSDIPPPSQQDDIPPPPLPQPSSSSSKGEIHIHHTKNASVPPLSVIAQLPYSTHSKSSKRELLLRAHSEHESPQIIITPREIPQEDKYSLNAIISPRPTESASKHKKKESNSDETFQLKKSMKSKSTTPMGSPQPQPQSCGESPTMTTSKAGRLFSKILTKKRAATVGDIQVPGNAACGEGREPPSFLTTFYTPELRENLEEFLRKKYVHEIIEFINDCDNFAEANFETNESMTEEAKRIYDRYIAEGSPMEINISYQERDGIRNDVFSKLDQGVFEKISRVIRDSIETSFFSEWKRTGAWKTIPFLPLKLRPPTMTRVIENKRLWNQLIHFISASSDGHKYVEFYKKAEKLMESPSVLGLGVISSFYSEFFSEPAMDKHREVTYYLEKAMKNFYSVLERKYYPNWVLQREWDCVHETHIEC